MCQCLEGEQVDWENLRTPEQQKIMGGMYYPLLAGAQQGSTPFGGQLSAPMSGAQKMAMTTMADIGGYGWKPQKAQYKSVADLYDPKNINNLPVKGVRTTEKKKTNDGPDPYVTSNTKQASDQSADVSLNEDLIPYLLNALSQMQSMGGQFNYDPRNPQA